MEATWPEPTRRWVEQQASRLAGSAEFAGDLAISPTQEDEFRGTLGSRKALACHCTRLLPHEVATIRSNGLRLLDEQLIRERIADAITHDLLSEAARREAEIGNIYATRNTQGRVGQVCFVLGRKAFDESVSSCSSLLRYWGGEAIRGGPSEVPALAGIGTASIVVAKLDLARPHHDASSWPALSKVFVGSLLGLAGCSADIHYRESVPGTDVIAVWQPGQPEYDRHVDLPR